jgi:hypothetical protein
MQTVGSGRWAVGGGRCLNPLSGDRSRYFRAMYRLTNRMGQAGEVAESSEEERALQAQRFEQLFGVTESALREQGMDPDQYVQENLHRVMKKRKSWTILPLSTQYNLHRVRALGWGYAFIFVRLGFLFLSNVHGLRWLGIGAAVVAAGVAWVFITRGIRFQRLCRKASRDEGMPPWRKGQSGRRRAAS